jgi:hypothetical protein
MRPFMLALAAAVMLACGAVAPADTGPATPEAAGAPGGAFVATAPIADVCSLLTTADVQTLLPGARPGVEQEMPAAADAGFWSRDCKWDVSDTSTEAMELVVYGATVEEGLLGLKSAAQGKTGIAVSGLGTEAYYWIGPGTNGLWVVDGAHAVNITAYFLNPAPSQGQFQPLVTKVLDQIR